MSYGPPLMYTGDLVVVSSRRSQLFLFEDEMDLDAAAAVAAPSE